MHPYTTRGRAGALSSVFFESLLEGTADEIGASTAWSAKPWNTPRTAPG
jgi:hypothetical protein